jgi:hypothetical protein
MQKFTPRYGCWFWCGCPPPALGWSMFGAKVVFGALDTKGRFAVLLGCDKPPLATGDPLRLVASDGKKPLMP